MLISQGSSGSDRPLLRAVQVILAALQPETNARLTEARLIAPMVQQILSRSLATDRASYMASDAHPSAIAPKKIDLAKLIIQAQSVAPDEIPPMVTLKLLRENPPDASIFADGLTETLFATPDAIARVWRGAQSSRVYEIEAMAEDPNRRNLSYHWRVLHGDPARVRIEPLDGNGARVRLTIGWQEPASAPGRTDILASRIDIAALAENDAEISAPAFFSIALPLHQERFYTEDDKPLKITHNTGRGAPYADALIWPRRGWEEQFAYSSDGALTGWTRTLSDEQGKSHEMRYTSHGLLVDETDPLDRPVLAREVHYPISRTVAGGVRIAPTMGEKLFGIDYGGAHDWAGKITPLP